VEVLAPNGDRVSRVGGLESKLGRGPRALDRRGMGWSRLCLGHRRGVCFGVPSWDTLIRESPRDAVPTWLWSSTVVRTGT
jgi:hypothetical protein